MTKREADTIQTAFRLAPEQVRQLALLAGVFGGKSRALTVALDRLYQATLKENAAFAELVAVGNEPPADADPA